MHGSFRRPITSSKTVFVFFLANSGLLCCDVITQLHIEYTRVKKMRREPSKRLMVPPESIREISDWIAYE